jgi:thiamine biosynthesis lipoprotein
MLGTLVAIRVYDLPEADAHRAVDAAFDEIAATQQAMSFHDPDSDVSRLNREAYCQPVRVGPHTRLVLRLAEATDGAFDITTAAELVEWGLLPRPESFLPPDPQASWRDILICSNGEVSFRCPLWVDLGGIAKGYAIDRAVACLSRHGVRRCCINAGGDLRVVGPSPERIRLRVGQGPTSFAAVVELENGSLASSGDHLADATPIHVDGINRRPVGRGAFACVVAESCAVADALTKPILALGEHCDALLRHLGATAHLIHANGDWQHFGASA